MNFYPSQQKVLQPGARLRVFGELRGGFWGTEMIHPRFRVLHGEEALPTTLTPVYPTTAGLGQATLRRLIERALQEVDLAETLPDAIVKRLQLADFAASVRSLHTTPADAVPPAVGQRIAFDELLAQQISLRQSYAARRLHRAPSLTGDGTLTNRLLAQLPFKLTGAQQRVWQEIARDLAEPHPMQRLLQGDVGSGKTVLAALAMLRTVEAGYQAALMAPTEILAEQHYRKLASWLAPLGLEVAWLSGSQKKRDKLAALAKVGAGETAIASAAWTFGALPELLEVEVAGRPVLGFPALVDDGAGVRLTAFDTEDQARSEHRKGLARLFSLQLAAQVKAIEKLPDLRNMAIQFMPLGTEKELQEQLIAATLERTCLMAPLPTEESAFAARRDAAKGRILLVAQEIVRLLGSILAEHATVLKKLAATQKTLPQACSDIKAQLDELLQKNFIIATPYERLQSFPRYLKAVGLRLDKAKNDAARDARLMADWQALAQTWARERNAMRKAGVSDPFLEEYRWLLEELRVALFAQELRTPSPVSVKRLQKMWEGRARS
jgi:hypothetical protein